eukprot:GILK01004057.1.p1 GENE.GILK01004057.1~~GILK01004057.1.p1  ORF type:complete len:169 (+),score=26.26 GILK01004057.1:53-508(+)
MDTRTQNAWRETIMREKRQRSQWIEAEYRRTLGGKLPQLDKTRSSTKTKELQKTKDIYIPGITLKRFDITTQRPPTRDLLLNGVSKEGEGRYAYLKHRSQSSPKQRFGRPMTSAQEVGWGVDQVQLDKAHFARLPLVRETFFRRNGVNLPG